MTDPAATNVVILPYPTAQVNQVCARGISNGANLSKDARIALQKAAVVLTLAVSGVADGLRKSSRSTLTAEDVIAAVTQLRLLDTSVGDGSSSPLEGLSQFKKQPRR